MKRSICGILVLLCIFLYVLPVSAVSYTTYRLETAELSLELPDSLTVITRDNFQDMRDKLLDQGLSPSLFLDFMYDSAIHLNAWSKGISYEITYSQTPDPTAVDFYQYSDRELELMIPEIELGYSAQGLLVDSCTLYLHPQVKFFKVQSEGVISGKMSYNMQYYASLDKKTINVILYSYDTPITEEMESMMDRIVDSMVFDELPKHSLKPDYTYTDPATGAYFIVPGDWIQKSVADGTGSVRFISPEDPTVAITYESQDLWGQWSENQRAGRKRSDISITRLSSSEAAEILGFSMDQTQKVSYSGMPYYQYDDDTSVITATLQNGYRYAFTLSSPADSEALSALESILATTGYPIAEPETEASSDAAAIAPLPALPKGGDKEAASASIKILLSVMIAAAACLLPIVIFRFAVKRMPMAPQKARWVTLIYTLCTALLMAGILYKLNAISAGIAALLMGIANYWLLTAGYQEIPYTPQFAPLPPSSEQESAASVGSPAPADSYPPPCLHTHADGQESSAAQPLLQCPHCGAVLAADSRFCSSCGKPLPTPLDEDQR